MLELGNPFIMKLVNSYIPFLYVIIDYLNSKGIKHRDLKPEI